MERTRRSRRLCHRAAVLAVHSVNLVLMDMCECNAGGPSKKNAQDPYADRPALRRFLLNGDFFVAATLGSILVKLCTRYMQLKVACMFYAEELTT